VFVSFLRCVLVALLVWLSPCRSDAHEAQPAVLAMKEIEQNRFVLRWLPPNTGHAVSPVVELHFPEQCQLGQSNYVRTTADSRAQLPGILECAAPGLSGELTFTSLGSNIGPIAVNIDWLTTEDWFRVTTSNPPLLDLPGRQRGLGWLEAAGDFLILGVEHIWGGPDHVLFVLGLLLLVRTRKRLLVTITAFTVAHSITLTTATLGLVRLPSGPVEICIALSIFLLAFETSRPSESLTRRAPWLVAFSFGLLHGFGFASALASTEIPPDRVVSSLLSFNLGVEVGQLGLIAVSTTVWAISPARWRNGRRLETLSSFVLGAAATYWLLQRLALWLSNLA
jgi:hydrogenase/urease accessory protein HupE